MSRVANQELAGNDVAAARQGIVIKRELISGWLCPAMICGIGALGVGGDEVGNARCDLGPEPRPVEYAIVTDIRLHVMNPHVVRQAGAEPVGGPGLKQAEANKASQPNYNQYSAQNARQK
jgi:hypothetical protein